MGPGWLDAEEKEKEEEEEEPASCSSSSSCPSSSSWRRLSSSSSTVCGALHPGACRDRYAQCTLCRLSEIPQVQFLVWPVVVLGQGLSSRQRTVDVPQLPSRVGFVQFLDKVVDMPIVVLFFDKVVDVPVVQVSEVPKVQFRCGADRGVMPQIMGMKVTQLSWCGADGGARVSGHFSSHRDGYASSVGMAAMKGFSAFLAFFALLLVV